MASFKLTNKAVEDLNKIWIYTFENWSELRADKYYHTLLNSCKEIASNPGKGKNILEYWKDCLGIKQTVILSFIEIYQTGLSKLQEFCMKGWI